MPTYPVYNLSDKHSTVAATSGAALTAEYTMQAFPQSQNKRKEVYMTTLAPTAGATAAEAFIDGVSNFRLRLAANSTVLLKVLAVYNCSVSANNAAFEITAAFHNVADVLTAIANSISTKFPTAGGATLVITLSGANLVFTCTGVAGDANGRWSIRVILDEVTDIG